MFTKQYQQLAEAKPEYSLQILLAVIEITLKQIKQKEKECLSHNIDEADELEEPVFYISELLRDAKKILKQPGKETGDQLNNKFKGLTDLINDIIDIYSHEGGEYVSTRYLLYKAAAEVFYVFCEYVNNEGQIRYYLESLNDEGKHPLELAAACFIKPYVKPLEQHADEIWERFNRYTELNFTPSEEKQLTLVRDKWQQHFFDLYL